MARADTNHAFVPSPSYPPWEFVYVTLSFFKKTRKLIKKCSKNTTGQNKFISNYNQPKVETLIMVYKGMCIFIHKSCHNLMNCLFDPFESNFSFAITSS